jgi:hypothetical protein
MASLVGHLGSQLGVLVTQVSRQRKGREMARNNAQAQLKQEESSSSEHEHDTNEEGGTNEEEQKDFYNEDFVSHAFYRQHIEKGFERRSPPKMAFSKPLHYPIDDTVTRTLATSKFTSKLTAYTLSVSNAFFASTPHAIAKDALAAHLTCKKLHHPAQPICQQLGSNQGHATRPHVLLETHVRSGVYTDTKRFRQQRPHERVHPHCPK